MTPPTSHLPLRKISDHLIELLLLASLLVIFYFTLFPFDFAFSSWGRMAREVAAKFELRPNPALKEDIRNNILLFMPLGFCIAALAIGRMRLAWLLVLAATSGGAISALVELLQVFLGRRNSSINDVLANAAGALAGAVVLMAVRAPLVRAGRATANWLQFRPTLTRRLARAARLAVLASWAAWLLVHIYLPIRLYHAGWIIYWNTSYPLIIGNEATADRPWDGTIRRVSMADRAATADEAARLAQGKSPAALFGPSLLCDFDLAVPAKDGGEALADRVDPRRILRWQGTPRPLGPNGAPVGPDGFLTCRDMADIIRRMTDADQFTIVVEAAPSSLTLEGPARIVGLSGDIANRDVTIAQEKKALIVRLRFPLTGSNGANPELMVDNVFTDTRPRRIVVTYGSAEARVCVDGLPPRQEAMRFVPELAVMWRLFPRWGFVFRMGTSAVPVYQVLYRVLVFGTLGSLLAVAAMTIPVRGRWLVGSFLTAGWILPAAIIEGIQAWIDGRFDTGPAALSLLIGMAGSLLGWLWARRLLPKL